MKIGSTVSVTIIMTIIVIISKTLVTNIMIIDQRWRQNIFFNDFQKFKHFITNLLPPNSTLREEKRLSLRAQRIG